MRKIFEFKSNWAKIAPLVFAIVTFPLAFEQCRNRDEPKSKVTILFWHSLVASSVPALSDLLKKFHEEHTGIEVKAQYIPTGDALIQKLITAIQSRTTPDVSWIHSNYLEHLVQSDAIYPMEKFINGPNGFTTEEMDDFFPAMLQLASWNKTLYSLPMEATNLGLLYNRELFRSAGLDPDRPPQTWEELREFAKKLTIDNDGDGKLEQIGFWVPVFPSSGPLFTFMVWQWYPFLWQAGGYEINLEQTKVLFDSDAGVKALALWKNIHKDLGLASFTIDYDVAFISKKLAMALDGPWNLPTVPRIEKP